MAEPRSTVVYPCSPGVWDDQTVTIKFGSPRFHRAMELTGATVDASGMRCGSFHLHALIAEGGQAKVWLATGDMLALTRLCVVKVFSRPDRDTIDRANRSRDTQLSLLNRHNSIHVPDVIAWDMGDMVGPWIAQDFRGPDLRKYLRSVAASRVNASSRSRVRRSVLGGIVNAVASIHRGGVVHRDLKPANILVDVDRSPLFRRRVTLCDLDLAKGDDQATLTQTGVGMGTFGYSAPEQLLGLSRATAASDVYSVAMLAVFVLTGRDPWDVIDSQDLTNVKLSASIAEDLGDTREWVEGALSFWPEKRPQLNEIDELLNAEDRAKTRAVMTRNAARRKTELQVDPSASSDESTAE